MKSSGVEGGILFHLVFVAVPFFNKVGWYSGWGGFTI